MKNHVHAAWLGVVLAASGAAGQTFLNGNFETGSLSPWVVTPTAGGTSLATGVTTYDVDGPKPFPASNTARFMVGRVSPPLPPAGWEGIELTQPLELSSSEVYTLWLHWSVQPLVNVYGESGGRFDIIADGESIGTVVAPPTTGLATSYGYLHVDFWPTQSGIHNVGVRITRPVLAGEEVYQYIDNFEITNCYGDCNNSGTLSIADYTCFQTRFLLQDPYADCNQNGTFTVSDFTCHLSYVASGCP